MNTVQTICTVITCVVLVGGILIFIGRSLGTLNQITEGLQVLFSKTDRHETDISGLKVELARVLTRQEDCEKCP